MEEHALQTLVEQKKFTVLFQPVVSIQAKRVVGFEALSRAIADNNKQLTPAEFFAPELPRELRLQADRLCRAKALRTFKNIFANHPDQVLFINLSPELFPDSEDELGHTDTLVQKQQLSAANICLEIPARSLEIAQARAFWTHYRIRNYKLSLDNLNTGDNVLDMVATMNPDYLKVGRSFHAGGEMSMQAKEKLEIITRYASRMNTRVVAFGVEKESEAKALAEAGMHLHQGFYYTKDNDEAAAEAKDDAVSSFMGKVEKIHGLLRRRAKDLVQARRDGFQAYRRLASKLTYRLSGAKPEAFDQLVKEACAANNDIISLFILTHDGVQATDRPHRQDLNVAFTAVEKAELDKGADHSLYDYYVHLSVDYDKFITESFISPYTHTRSILVCEKFYAGRAKEFILCIELPAI